MDIINVNKTKAILKKRSVYVSLSLAFIVMMLFFPNEGKFPYEYHKGRPWMYETLVAPIDFPILKTDAELFAEKDAAASKVVPYYIYDESVGLEQQNALAHLQVRYSIPSDLERELQDALRHIYEEGIIPDKSELSPSRTSYVIVQREKRATEVLLTDLYTVASAWQYVKNDIFINMPQYNADSLLTLYGVDKLVQPNLLFSQQNTDLLHKEAMDYISPTKGMVYSGQLIVTQGETITAEIQQLLDSYKAEYELSYGYTGNIWQLYFAHVFICIVVLLLVYVTIYFVNFNILTESNRFNFILLVVLMAFMATAVARQLEPHFMYMVPYAVFALYMMAFFRNRLVFPIYMISLLPLLVISENGIELYMLNLVAGGIALVSFSFLYRGWLQFLNSLLIFVGMFILHMAFRMMEGGVFEVANYRIISFIFCNAFLVVAAYPLVFLLEKIFMLVSVATLKDLSDTNNRLLQELARKAPGTFQHSLQVANLAERAVLAIRGNSRLVKVGAMYHDIGKINNPQCFIENQAPGVQYHKDLSPQESAKEIIRHVADGVEIAKKHNLPQIVIDFITSHHGRSQTAYFYMQYCNNGGDPANTADFTYQGTLPTAKEQVVVMMADAVEAASRTLKDYSAESISKLVEGITSQRINDSQLAMADISIKEINIVKAVFKKHLQEIYHARIAYPPKKEESGTSKRDVLVNEDTE
ncbi:MAG: HDIG domain-containing protein [Bacteroidales bacterium]|nr:HDIG domain-containing protein [Bacteroidales bacterium]